MKAMGTLIAVVVVVAVVVAAVMFLRRGAGSAVAATGSDPLLAQIEMKYPNGPVRRGSLGDDHPGAIKEILIFDADDHWFFVFLGLRAVGQPFELSLRTAKNAGESGPPDWPVEPATRVGDAVRDGMECARGATWKLGAFSDEMPKSAGFLTLLDREFGEATPDKLLQLVPVTQDEVSLTGDEKWALLGRLYKEKSRMIGEKL